MEAKIHAADTGAPLTALELSDQLRQALAQELHDGLGQLLVGASLIARGLLDDAPSELRGRVERLTTLLGYANRVTHEMAAGWSPWLSRPGSPCERIVELSRQIRETFDIACQVELGDALDGVDEDAGIQLFLLVREAVMNAVRHSGCGALSIVARRRGASRELVVRDDGRGFSGAAAAPGFGIRSMQARAHALGGKVELRTPEGAGLEVCCTW